MLNLFSIENPEKSWEWMIFLAKKYSDMFNKNVWLDDTLVVDGSIHKYYSVLPRIEIRIRYLNMLYNRSQYNSITNRVDYDGSTDLSYFQKKG